MIHLKSSGKICQHDWGLQAAESISGSGRWVAELRRPPLTCCLRGSGDQHQRAEHQTNLRSHLGSSGLSIWCFRYVDRRGASSALKISWGSRAEEQRGCGRQSGNTRGGFNWKRWASADGGVGSSLPTFLLVLQSRIICLSASVCCRSLQPIRARCVRGAAAASGAPG